MSNQVFANNTGRYFPAVEQKDVFTLIKNNAGVPPYGTRSFPLQDTGAPIQFNTLNNFPMFPTAGRWPYDLFQNPTTKPYWTLSSSATVLGNALLLTAITSNTVAVEAILPGYITGYSLGDTVPVKLCLMLLDDIFSFSTAKVVAMNTRVLTMAGAPTGNPSSDQAFSTTVNMLPGQILALYVFSGISGTPGAWVASDDTNGLARVLIECSLSFSKV
jgi:hypothetical protein